MLTEAEIKRVKRLRAVEGLTWEQIEERTGIPASSAYGAVMGRRNGARHMRQFRQRRANEQIRMLRHRVKQLEAKLKERRQA